MKYVLILFFKSGYAGGMAVAEFDDLSACEFAQEKIVSEWSSRSRLVLGECLPKGSE